MKIDISKFLESKHIAYNRAIKNDMGENISIRDIVNEYADQLKLSPISQEEIEKLAEERYTRITSAERTAYKFGFNKCAELNAGKESDAISFAEFLKADFVMADGENGDIYWQLYGTKQNYTTEKIYNDYIQSLKPKT